MSEEQQTVNNREQTEHQNTRLKIHWGRFAIWAVLVVIALVLLFKIYHTILAFGLAGLMAYILSPAVRFFAALNIPFTKRKIPWMASIIIVYFLLISITITSGIILIPMAIDQMAGIIEDTPVLISKIQDALKSMEVKYQTLHIPKEVEVGANEFITASISKVGSSLGVVFKSIWELLKNVFSGAVLIIFCMIIALFMLANVEDMMKKFYSYIPPDYQDDVKDLLQEINDIFGSYVRGYSILCIVNGSLTYLTLVAVILILRAIPGFAAGFPVFNYTLVASIVAGATYFIPYLGCSTAVVVGMALAFLQFPSFTYVITIGLIILLTNQFVDRFITPKILGDALGVSTLFIVFAAFAGGELMGVWGMVLGIPVSVMIQSILRFIYKRFLAFPVSEEILAPAHPPQPLPSLEMALHPQKQGGGLFFFGNPLKREKENKTAEKKIDSNSDS